MLRAITCMPGVMVGSHLASKSIPLTPQSGCKEKANCDPAAVCWGGGTGKEGRPQHKGTLPLYTGLTPKQVNSVFCSEVGLYTSNVTTARSTENCTALRTTEAGRP